MRNIKSLVFLILGCAPYSADAKQTKKFVPNLNDQHRTTELQAAFSDIENKLVASTLRDGIKSLNDSIKTLMDSVFYSLMDRTASLKINSNFSVGANYDREVHETALGSYVVIDQFHIGPELFKNLANIGAAPLNLTSDGGFTVSNITHQTEANRAIDQQDSSLFEATVKNWFGLLPVLDKILPVSFNPLELYDPIQYLKTPFLFPFEAKQINSMPLGTIRSITLSGGLTLSIDALLPEQDTLKDLINIENLTSIFPYGITKNGSHRINVMRKSRDVTWLAITDSNELGHQLTLDISSNYFALNRLFPSFKGVKIPLSPIKQFYADLKIKTYDQIYEFDFRIPEAKVAYEKAVRGHLVLADRLSKKPQKKSGVTKKFTRKILADEFRDFGAHSAYIINHKNHSLVKSGLSKISIKNKVNYIMFAKSASGSEVWDLAAGKDSNHLQTNFEIMVKKKDKNKDDLENFETAPASRNPYHLITNFNFLNKTANTVDFNRTIKELIYYTGFSLGPIPKFDTNTNEEIQRHKSEVALLSPEERIKAKSLQPHRLGHFQVSANVSFPYKSLLSLTKASESMLEQSLVEAFSNYYDATHFSTSSNFFTMMSSYLLNFLRIFEVQFPKLDFSREVSRFKLSIATLKSSNDPKILITTYAKMFDTPYTLQVIYALRHLVERQQGDISTSIQITTKPIGGATDSKSMRYKFQALNSFHQHTSKAPIKSFTTNLIDTYIERFTNNTLASSIPTPVLKDISFYVHTDKSEKRELTSEIRVKPIGTFDGDIFCYLKLEETGVVDISRFRLGDKIMRLKQTRPEVTKSKISPLHFKLSGNDGLFTPTELDEAFSKEKSYDFYVSLSEDKSNWSQPVLLKLKFHKDGSMTFP